MKMFVHFVAYLIFDILSFTDQNFIIYASILLIILFSCIICRWISSKEIHKEYIRYWKRKIPHLMCEMQKYLPPGFFNAQEHYLINQIEEIEICGPVYTRSMWMVESHLNSWKDFLDKEHILRVLLCRDIWYINPWCTLVGIFQIQQKILIFLTFCMSTPSTNLKGRPCWGKVEQGK